MTDGQISFYSTTDEGKDSLNVPEGAVIISKRDEEKRLADLYAVLDGQRYQLKPSYKYDEIQGIEEKINESIEGAALKALLKYFYVDIQNVDDETVITFKANSDDGLFVSSNGELVTVSELNDGIENGTFLVGERPISIGGLKSAAYTESEDYSPMAVSTWTDL